MQFFYIAYLFTRLQILFCFEHWDFSNLNLFRILNLISVHQRLSAVPLRYLRFLLFNIFVIFALFVALLCI